MISKEESPRVFSPLPEVPQEIIDECLGRLEARDEAALSQGFCDMAEHNPVLANYIFLSVEREREFLFGTIFMYDSFLLEMLKKGEQPPCVSWDTIKSWSADAKALWNALGITAKEMLEDSRNKSSTELYLIYRSHRDKIKEEFENAHKESGYTPLILRWSQLNNENIPLWEALLLFDPDGISDFGKGAAMVLEYLWRQAQVDKLVKDLGLDQS